MRTAPQAIAAANRFTTNRVGTCQKFTHELFEPNGSLAVGDFDGDGDADAVDGWKSEPKAHQHTDRRPKIGSVGAWGGGSHGYGHRAICIGYLNGEALFRSTDGNGAGRMGNHTLGWFESEWGLKWLGWSDTISGRPIQGLVDAPGTQKPTPAPAKVKPKPKSRGTEVDNAIKALQKAKAPRKSERSKLIQAALADLTQIAYL